jgi:hypothetical protein
MSDGPTIARIDQESNNNGNNGNDTDGVNFDPWVNGNTEGGNADGTNNFSESQIESWRERERRQRSVRSFMMFLLMMMLMDGEEQTQQRRQRQQQLRAGGLRGTANRQNKNIDNINSLETDMELYRARRTQDHSIEDIILKGNHSRVNRLIQRNDGRDFDREIREWAEEQRNIQTRAFYEQLLRDLVIEQPDGSYVKVLVASASNNEAVTVANDPSKILLDAASLANKVKNTNSIDNLDDARRKFDEFLDAEREVWHYPWNATGYYRGDWKTIETEKSSLSQGDEKIPSPTASPTTRASIPVVKVLSPIEAETPLLQYLQNQADPSIGVHILPPGIEFLRSTNRTVMNSGNRKEITATERLRRKTSENADNANSNISEDAFSLGGTALRSPLPAKLSLTKTSGKIAFQLYSKAVPAMKELSLIDGYIKVCDSDTVGYPTRRDVLLRVHGVLIHSLGRLSLVANPRSTERAALLINDVNEAHLNTSTKQETATETIIDSASESEDRRRRLQELLSQTDNKVAKTVDDATIEEIRIHALKVFGENDHSDSVRSSYASTINGDLQQEYTLSQQKLEKEEEAMILDSTRPIKEPEEQRRLEVEDPVEKIVVEKEDVDEQPSINREKNTIDSRTFKRTSNLMYSKHVIPYPFAWDDVEQSLQRKHGPVSTRSISAQEKSLGINAGSCEFEINMDVQEEKWTVGEWKKLMTKHAEHELSDSILANKLKESSTTTKSVRENSRDDAQRQRLSSSSGSKSQKRASMEQAWVMTFNGTIEAPNCDFKASVNSTAIRTDWETTTGKAINYAFYMMTICLTQIVLLLRQLLHTQSQSASVRVSLLCIGWQTVIDALLCLAHIYLSLAMQPLFTAFASVAFFKLLIFCVIEMKYMAIIIQSRNTSNGGNSVELLRRQIAMLHARFYVGLMGSCVGFFYSNNYRTLYMLMLYSFWIPQIVHNVVTEAKKPMHPYYICGMSITRMVAPLYMFANEGNFLKEVYPESPTNFFMCQLIVFWVVAQAGLLCAQSRFGARFFIPAQFLPPKYDYNRPIPTLLLPPGNETANPSEQLQKERELPKTEVRSLVVPNRELNSRGGVARNRKEGKRTKGETVMTAETVTEVRTGCCAPCLECVICYNDIDTSNRTAYMIAPCNHVFHKECLVQWMEVKMECPVCRHNLPAP